MRPAIILVMTGCSSILGISDPTAGQSADANPGGDGANHVLQSIAIGPDPLLVGIGQAVQLEVTGTFADGEMDDLTAQAMFSVDSGTAATVTPTGSVQGIEQGAATIRATSGGFADTLVVSVTSATPDHLLLSLGDIAIKQQQRVQAHVTLVFSDSSTQDATTTATWQSDDEGVAAVTAGQIDAQQQAGPATITASVAGIPPVSLIATVSILTCHVVINEVQSGSSLSASDEWAEIYNPCTQPIDVSNLTLNYRAASANGTQDTNFLIQLAGVMAPGELRLYGASAVPETLDDTWGNGVMQQNNGALALRDGPTSAGPIIDSVAYGSVAAGHPFVEGTAAPGLVNGKSIARTPFDGNDTEDGGTNFTLTSTPTPHVLNAP
jgi:Big-like domain-containing protein